MAVCYAGIAGVAADAWEVGGRTCIVRERASIPIGNYIPAAVVADAVKEICAVVGSTAVVNIIVRR